MVRNRHLKHGRINCRAFFYQEVFCLEIFSIKRSFVVAIPRFFEKVGHRSEKEESYAQRSSIF